VLALGPFEQLDDAGAGLVPGISQETGTKRYFRAPKRLKDAQATLLGDWEGF
jgi:hypothetical protein